MGPVVAERTELTSVGPRPRSKQKCAFVYTFNHLGSRDFVSRGVFFVVLWGSCIIGYLEACYPSATRAAARQWTPRGSRESVGGYGRAPRAPCRQRRCPALAGQEVPNSIWQEHRCDAAVYRSDKRSNAQMSSNRGNYIFVSSVTSNASQQVSVLLYLR